MKISVDGGALCGNPQNRFGNYAFAKNIIEAISTYDKTNEYTVYSFCNQPRWLKINWKKILPKRFWMSLRVSIEEVLGRSDYFLALNQALPFYTRSKIITFSHGLAFHFYPDLYPDSAGKMEKQVHEMIKRSYKIVVSSKKVRQEFMEIDRTITDKIEVIPFGVPFDMYRGSQEKKKEKYFLFVGMDHPVKNLKFLISNFRKITNKIKFKEYKLLLVGNHKEHEDKKNGIICLENVSRRELKVLYQKATCYLATSLYESFNLPVLEALLQGCPVIGLKSAIIPELEKYVTVLQNEEGLLKAMQKVVEGRSEKIDGKKIFEEFSWEKYIDKLKKLYA